MEDKTIIELFFRRSEKALEETVTKYGAYCRTIAQNVLTQPEDAEECVNEIWLAAWNDIPPSRPDSLRAYLGRLTRNLAISRWRSLHAKKRFSGMESLLSELEDCLPAPGGVEAELERAELAAILRTWVDSLDFDERAAFVRRYWHGVSVKQLAAEAGVTQNAMAQRLLKLRRNLKQKLEQEEIDL